MSKKETGLLVCVNKDWVPMETLPDMVTIESGFGKLRKEAERVAEAKGFNQRAWDFTDGDGRYLILSHYWNDLEVRRSNTYLEYQDDYYIYDLVGKRWTDEITWEKREKATQDPEDAMHLLSVRMMQGFGSFDEDDLEEMESFAKKWKIPFSAELFGCFDEMFNEQYPYWNSSSAKC